MKEGGLTRDGRRGKEKWMAISNQCKSVPSTVITLVCVTADTQTQTNIHTVNPTRLCLGLRENLLQTSGNSLIDYSMICLFGIQYPYRLG